MEQCEYIANGKCCFCQEILDCSQLELASDMILEKCFQELGSFMEHNFKSCRKCLQFLENFYKFVIICTNSTQKIEEFCTTLNISPQDVNLFEVYQFLYSSVDNDSCLTSAVKLEDEENQNLMQSAKEKVKVVRNRRKRIRKFECQECTYETKKKSDLKRHMLVHRSPTELEMFKCYECTFETKLKSCLRSHLLKHRSPTQVEMFKCEECTYETKHKKYLKCHVLKHRSAREIKMFMCAECMYETRYKGYLKQHMLKHKSSTEVEIFKCKKCTFKTKYKSVLKKHIVKHEIF